MRITPIVSKVFAAWLCLSIGVSLRGQPDTHALAKRAAFIFTGEAAGAREAKLAHTPMPSPSLVVRVVDVLYVKPSVSVRPGDLVIVQTAGESLPAGTRATFYTNGWGYGKYLIVRELGHVVQTTPQERLKQEITQAKSEAEDDRIRQRLAAAELVIAGTVKATRPFEEANKGAPVSEHNADWWLAEVEVTQLLKGEAGKKIVLVAYPNSRDVMWADSPKFKAGQAGIWILRRPKNLIRLFEAAREPVYTAINVRDFHEPKEVDRIVKLLKTPSPNQ